MHLTTMPDTSSGLVYELILERDIRKGYLKVEPYNAGQWTLEPDKVDCKSLS